MNKMILRVGLALVCVAFLATSLIGQQLGGGSACPTTSTDACVSCCTTNLGTALGACLKTGGKDLCSCLAAAFTTDGSCLSGCPPPPKYSGPGCNNW